MCLCVCSVMSDSFDSMDYSTPGSSVHGIMLIYTNIHIQGMDKSILGKNPCTLKSHC